MVTRTQYKLSEAEFFYQHVLDNSKRTPDVDFYVSAFLSAARSVTWIMKAEFLHIPGWKEWHEAAQFDGTAPDRLKKLNDLRTKLTKIVPLRTLTSVHSSIREEDFTPEVWASILDGSTSFSLSRRGATSEIVDYVLDGVVVGHGVLTHVEQGIEQFPGESVEDVCGAYLIDLRKLVEQCHHRFGRALNEYNRKRAEECQRIDQP